MIIVREAYVFLQINGEDVVAAKIVHSKAGGRDQFHFRYGKSFLGNPHAFSIDPRELPLRDAPFIFNRLPLAIQDNGPDEFGKYLYERLHQRSPESPLDYHISHSDLGIGSLVFSDSPDRISGYDIELASLNSLEALCEAISTLEKKQRLDPAFERILAPGSSLGGARPKALVKDEQGSLWIAKLSRDNDVFNMPIAEYVAMSLARQIGIQVADHRLVKVAKQYIYLTKRFDRSNGVRHHFLSAFTLMGADRANASNIYEVFSYPSLAEMLKRVSKSPNVDRKELFKRMVFNCFIANRDDHLKNHAFLKEDNSALYRLSPAYDIVPGAISNIHAIGIGELGAVASIENIFSRIKSFGLSKTDAEDIVEMVSDATLRIPSILAKEGMVESEIQRIEGTLLL